MSKKKNRKKHQAQQKSSPRKSSKSHQHKLKSKSAHQAASQVAPSKHALVALPSATKVTETTFSKKLEEAISENELVSRKGLFGGRVILLGPPTGYTQEEWRIYLRRILKIVLKFLAVILLVALVSSIVIVLELFSDHRVLPRVSFAGEDYGYMYDTEAKARLSEHLKGFEASSVTFHYNEEAVSIPISELGVTYELDSNFSLLPKFNFQGSNIVGLARSTLFPTEIKAAFLLDSDKFYNVVEHKLGFDKLRAHNAYFNLDDHKKMQIVPEKAGIMIDKAIFEKELSKVLSTQSALDLQVPTTTESPAVTTDDLKKFQSDIEVKLDNEITLHYGSKKWKFKPKNHLEDIVYDKLNGQIVIKISPSLISAFFQKEVFDSFEVPVGDLKISQDKDGKIVFDGRARNGLVVDQEKFAKDLELALNSLGSDMDISTLEIKSKVETPPELQAIGIKELISTGHTAFANSHTNRRHNIGVGMAKFNGLMIKPDETFSFNDNLGPVDASTGYQLELVIKAEGTVPDYGGGLCQVSSTAFKAALFAGLPIVERAPHSYAVSYYAQVDGYGLDATIYPGVRDLKFINDTGHNILMQSFTDGDQAYFNFFGTSDGRQVRLENYWRGNYRAAGGTELIPTTTLPTGAKKQIEGANGGFDASWERVITRNGQETREKIYSVYRATANRILVGQ